MNAIDLEAQLATLPDTVADLLEKWKIATLEREKSDAISFLSFKGQDKRTADEVKALVKASDEHYRLVLSEIRAESDYVRVYERLLALKRSANLRTAF